MDDLDNLDFESALGRLEGVVDDLERGDADLSEALGHYEQGVRLLARCHHLLDGAERTVALIAGVDEDGKPVLTPFDATASLDRETGGNVRPGRAVPRASVDDDEEPGSN